MKTIRVDLGNRSYDILIHNNILPSIGEKIADMGFSGKLGLVSNPLVYSLYGDTVFNALKKAGFDVTLVLIPDGEEFKDYNWAYYILGELLKNGLDRKSALVALGGGVIGDITGFVASTYMRGIGYIQVPTTLLSQVDSSVGGKTGVNHAVGKNMIGTFYQPRLVWIDVNTLKTLPKRQLANGMAEVLKYGVIKDRGFFDYLKANAEGLKSLSDETLIEVVGRSCQIKAEIVSLDERESGIRAILNYGHTVGHAIESISSYRGILHGEAVAVGMCVEAKLATLMAMFNESELLELKDVVKSFDLPVDIPGDMVQHACGDRFLRAVSVDKKAVGGNVKFVLPETIGHVEVIGSISDENILKSLNC